jgi:NADPH:quinone reductase
MNRVQAHRAATIVAPRTTRLMPAEICAPGAGEVRVKLQGSGLCASNLPVWEGRPWFQYPLEPGAPGHEGWGVVDAIGDDIDDLDIGDRVALISSHAYAEYDLAPRSAVVPLPRELGGEPFPGEPLGCAMNIFERSDVRADHTVAIVGAGFLGLLLAQLACKAGADVVVISHRACARDMARSMGANETVLSTDEKQARDEALRLSNGRGYDRVIETGGLQSTLDLASAIAAEYGRLVIAGYHQDGLRQVDMQQWNWRALDVINAHERSIERYAAGVEAAVRATLEGRIDPFPLLTHAVDLETLDDGFELMRARPDGFVKAVLKLEARA